MTTVQRPPAPRPQPGPRRVLPERLAGRSLLVGRAAWLAALVLVVVLAVDGSWRVLREPGSTTPAPAAELFLALGADLRLVALLGTVVPLILVVALCGIVFWRRSHDPMALLFTMTLLLFYAISTRVLIVYEGVPLLRHAAPAAFAGMLIGLTLVLTLFPDGRLVPRAARWLPIATLAFVIAFPDAIWLAEPLLQGSDDLSSRGITMSVGALSIIALGLLAQVVRYRRVSGSTERQQAKWVMGPIAVLMSIVALTTALSAVPPSAAQRWQGWSLLVALTAIALLPVGVGNAVLRYRLYEIDRILSRTMSYGLIIGALAAIYVTGVVTLGTAVSAFTGGEQQNELVVAASVLAVAALFRPIRSRAHTIVDRRFNRTGYEAQREVEGFANHLRDQVQLRAIREALAVTATLTLQPSQVSVWLTPQAREPTDG